VKLNAIEKAAFDSVPKILVYKQGEYYTYSSYFMKGLFLNFINRVLYPTVKLRNEEDIERFLNTEEEFYEYNDFFKNKYEEIGEYYKRMGKRTRVIGFFRDKKEYSNELKLLKQAAQAMAKRDDLRVAIVTDKDLIKKYKERYGVQMFDLFSHNSIVLTYEPGHFHFYNVEESSLNMGTWLCYTSLKKVDEWNKETQVIAEIGGAAKAILFINREDPQYGASSKVALDTLQRVAPFYSNRMAFFYAERQEFLGQRDK